MKTSFLRRCADKLSVAPRDSSALDGAERVLSHEDSIVSKPILRSAFQEIHRKSLRMATQHCRCGHGSRLELGAGIVPFQDTDPQILATDVVFSRSCDFLQDAQALALRTECAQAIFGQFAFHHFNQPRLFLEEALRVLKPGGVVVLIEPYFGPLAGLLFRWMFQSETFDRRAKVWETSGGPMSDANQALSYLVFFRDREVFEEEFPQIEICDHYVFSSWLRYLMSGGLNFRQLVPNWAEGLLRAVETICTPIKQVFALHHVVVLRKR